MSKKEIDILSPILSKPGRDQLYHDITAQLGTITSITEASGGLVHYVYKVVGADQTAFLKIRSNHFSRIPQITTDPSLIRDEHQALQMFKEKSPLHFPNVLLFNATYHYLLLSDIMPGSVPLDVKYEKNSVTQADIGQLGLAVGEIHNSVSDVTLPVRQPDDTAYQNRMLGYIFELSEHPALIKAAQEHKNRAKKLLIGDSSPKNTFVEGDKVGFCDLEGSYQGALAYDQGFLLAHVLLHQGSEHHSIEAMHAFIDGYSQHTDIDLQDDLLLNTIQAVLLFRLVNPVISYNLLFSPLQRKNMAANVTNNLSKKTRNIEKIAEEMFK